MKCLFNIIIPLHNFSFSGDVRRMILTYIVITDAAMKKDELKGKIKSIINYIPNIYRPAIANDIHEVNRIMLLHRSDIPKRVKEVELISTNLAVTQPLNIDLTSIPGLPQPTDDDKRASEYWLE